MTGIRPAPRPLTPPSGTVFDCSRDKGEPFPFIVGQRTVIEGWDRAVETMRQGERSRVVVKPELAYGAEGQAPARGIVRVLRASG